MKSKNKDQICSQCGHTYLSHELTEDGIGQCEMTIEEGKAIFKCVCEGEDD